MLLFPFWRPCFRVVIDGGEILVPDPATVQCGQRYNRKAGSSPCCQVVENSEKKNSKGDVKNIFWLIKIQPLILNNIGRKRAGEICREK